MNQLEKRLAALEGQSGFRPYCWCRAAPGEDQDQAIARHVAEGHCTPDTGGHVIWRAAQ